MEKASSESIGVVLSALGKAQVAFLPIHKSKEVEVKTKAGYTYKFMYATLDDIIAATKKALADNGLGVTQHAFCDGDVVSIETIMAHESGEYVSSTLTLTAESISPQAIGSAITYARRYAQSSILNVASEEDDDANFAGGNSVQNMSEKSSPKLADKKPLPKPAATPKPAKTSGKPGNSMGLPEFDAHAKTPEKKAEKTVFQLATEAITLTAPLDETNLVRLEGKISGAVNMTEDEIGQCMMMIARKRDMAEKLKKEQDAKESLV